MGALLMARQLRGISSSVVASTSLAFLRAAVDDIRTRDDIGGDRLIKLRPTVARRAGFGVLAPYTPGEPKQDPRGWFLNGLRSLRRIVLFQQGDDLGVHAPAVRLRFFPDPIPQAVRHADDVLVLG